ncbi:hypothetical protein AKJ65_00305 [candidate division MSBL1 archaeon SCGC-AAA259E19]|uniref:Uncharacterized protein n=1 Tax=candidate division MSBL1 archaeon SCGC-AAA259E19 TaxID=1698264 RepID=A0A133UNN7_9EURY|nr:hypothetical protein AKJ65_00305 [candidate division MSBL1 archaeon SCGC-AAA259E19]
MAVRSPPAVRTGGFPERHFKPPPSPQPPEIPGWENPGSCFSSRLARDLVREASALPPPRVRVKGKKRKHHHGALEKQDSELWINRPIWSPFSPSAMGAKYQLEPFQLPCEQREKFASDSSPFSLCRYRNGPCPWLEGVPEE